MTTLNTTRRLTVTTLLLAAALSLPGCWTPGGTRGYLSDTYTYESTPDMPQTVTVIDRRTNEALWSYDVPVDMELVMRFTPSVNTDDASLPDVLKWDVWKRGTKFGFPRNSVAMPDSSARLIDVKLRKSPELPESVKAREMGEPIPNRPAPYQSAPFRD
ncbi:hypothetical protein BH11PLA1_BH11PLA1_22420 [soil metagenome]